ncbi:MAG: endonuclease III [Tenericutes bacterium]|nr:endonuclease III [Mycoplasmatota bacterium]
MSKKSEFILDGLNKLIPNPRCELEFNKDYELLLAVMLSAQTTDKRVNMVTSELFKKYDTLEKLQTLTIPEIEEQIKTIGMYKTKARNFKEIVNNLIKIGYVPNDREVLESMSGVGRKTTNVVLSVLYNEPLIAVDTHVDRVSKRLGLAKDNDTVIDVENKLKKAFPKNTWTRLHQQLVLFGRYTCKSKNPECNNCPFKDICKYYKNVVKK